MAHTYIPKSKAIGAVNQEIINRIKEKKDVEIVFKYKYHITFSQKDVKFLVEEVRESQKGSDIITEWKKPITFKIPIDLFKDKVDYKCGTFADIERLNSTLLTVIEQYSFLDPVRAQSELEKFLNNFEVLQTCLGEIEGKLEGMESVKEEYEEKVKELNSKLFYLHCDKNVSFLPARTHITFGNHSPEITLSPDGLTATNTYGHHFLLGNKQFDTGVHTWSTKIHAMQANNWMMFGIFNAANLSRLSTGNSYCTPGNYASAVPTQLYVNGGAGSGGIGFTCQETVTVCLNCNDSSLTITTDTGKKVCIQIPSGRSWFPHFNLHGCNDIIELLSSKHS